MNLENKYIRFSLQAATVLIFVGIWDILVSHDILNSLLFPTSRVILETIWEHKFLLQDIVVSVRRLCFSVLIGAMLGVIVGLSARLLSGNGEIDRIVTFFMSIPGISWAPIAILYFGFGDVTIVLVGSLTAFFPVCINTYNGIKAVDLSLLRLGRVLGYSKQQSYIHILIPSISNYLIIGLKLAFSRAWRTIIAVEMIAASRLGLGYLIFDSRELLNTKMMFTGILMSGIMYIVIEKGIMENIERLTVHKWGMKL